MMVPIKVNKDSAYRESSAKNSKRSLMIRSGIILISISVIFIITALLINKYSDNESQMRQAVFTTTGQVYFGFVDDKNAEMVKISQAYYVNNSSSLFPAKPEDKVSLIRLGSEIFKPEDTVYINRQHILFIENITKDSQINAAILNSNK